MSKKLKWNTQKRKISDLKDHPTNPRTLSKKSHDDLLKSFEEFDYVELVAIDDDNTIVAGHQRVHIMLELGWGNEEIEVRVPNRKLTDKEQRKYLLMSNRVSGDWDFDMLANLFEMDELYECGFEEKDFHLGDWESNLDDSVDEDKSDDLDETVKIICPKGLKDSIIEMIKPLLKDLDVKIS